MCGTKLLVMLDKFIDSSDTTDSDATLTQTRNLLTRSVIDE